MKYLLLFLSICFFACTDNNACKEHAHTTGSSLQEAMVKTTSLKENDNKILEIDMTEKGIGIAINERPNVLRDSSINVLFNTISDEQCNQIFNRYPSFVANGFDFPVGKPNAQNYFRARNFGQQRHLGEDWNGRGGGNTDLGDPVYSIADGVVVFSQDVCCGWGNVIRIVHKLQKGQYEYVESVYAHLHEINAQPGDLIRRGDLIGSIGTAHGKYNAHLHLELRSFVNMSLGPGYSDDTFGYLDPTNFILKNRP